MFDIGYISQTCLPLSNPIFQVDKKVPAIIPYCQCCAEQIYECIGLNSH